MKITNKTITPLISVVMPVKNGEKYLAKAIESVLEQTYSNFEFLIVDDGSVDNTGKIIERYRKSDSRIKQFSLKKSGGISHAMNYAIKRAIGRYIVRADGDDICMNDRFNIQVEYMLSHPKVDVLGTYFCTFLNNNIDMCKTVPCSSTNIRDGRSPVHHPTCMIKRNIFKKFGYYNSNYDNAEDVDLWFRWFSKNVVFDNIPKVLYKKRIHQNSVSVYKIKHQVFLLLKINLNAIFKYGIKFSLHGYLYVIEQFLYLLYLSLHLDRLFVRDRSVYNVKRKAEQNNK